MKITINGKLYDSTKCERLAEKDHRSETGLYAGTSYLLRADDGKLIVKTDSNGNDLYLAGGLRSVMDVGGVDVFLARCKLTSAQEKRLAELGLLD